eukprot:CAMPEP_0174831928 /NCGR_PEP_ID=MMETSP1114-20130205/3385_1 /TAXON_ID=312471 /ORGANISM="Neobodo designis, Strain CCAP 1951/1" /LENGTH=710 /DNA_ID=CAMNT_0016065775 /DNA_START=54 /DNA_END=2186 /DNA_ORIENTATION=+
MREIVHFVAEGRPLPSVTSDDASRLYTTAFLQQIGVDTRAESAPINTPDPITHQKAKQLLETDLATYLKQAFAVNDVVGQTRAFVAVNRFSVWADRVFRRLCATVVEAQGYVVSKEDSVADAPINRVGVADVFAVHADARRLAASNRKTVAQSVCSLIESTAAMDADSEEFSQTEAILRNAVKLFLSEGVDQYRNVFETAMLTHFDSVLTHSVTGSASPAPPFRVATQRYKNYARLAASVLHPSSVRPLLNLVANDLFRSAAAIQQAVEELGAVFLAAGDMGSASGLLIRHREKDWSAAFDKVLRDFITNGAAGGKDGSCVATAASRMVDAALFLARSPGQIPAPRIAAQLAVSLSKCADGTSAASALALSMDRQVKSDSPVAKEFQALLTQLRSVINADDLGEALERLALRRAVSFTGFWSSNAEEAHTKLVIDTLGVNRFSRARRMVTEATESAQVVERTREVFTPSFELQLRALSHTWLRDVAQSSAFVDAPLPKALLEAWWGIQAVYKEQFPRRRLHHVSNASRVTLRWCATGTTIVMPAIHLAVLEHVLAGETKDAEANAQRRGKEVAPLDEGIRDMCERDLLAAGVLCRHGDTLQPDDETLHRRRHGEVSVFLGMHRRPQSSKDAGVVPARRVSANHRRFLLEASLTRLVKQYGTLPLPDLFRKSLSEGKLAFEPTAKEVRQCVTSLESKEYVTVNGDNVSYRA